jgi:hypothetical protein
VLNVKKLGNAGNAVIVVTRRDRRVINAIHN